MAFLPACHRVEAAIQTAQLLHLCQEAGPFTMKAFDLAFDIVQELKNETIDRDAIGRKLECILQHDCWKMAARRTPENIYWRDLYIGRIALAAGLPMTPTCKAAIDLPPDDWLDLHNNRYE